MLEKLDLLIFKPLPGGLKCKIIRHALKTQNKVLVI